MTQEWTNVGYVASRQRGMVRVVIGAALAGAGLAATIVGAIETATAQNDTIDAAVGEATVPGGTVTFDADDGPYTIFLLTPGLENSEQVERQVSSTECVARLADGDTATVRGARQAVSVTTGAASTVGWFTAVAGPTIVSCDYVRTERSPRDFAVSAGKPELLGAADLQLWGGIVALVVGILVLLWGLRGKTVVNPPERSH